MQQHPTAFAAYFSEATANSNIKTAVLLTATAPFATTSTATPSTFYP